jgi:nitroimidazol reductase NimA-like FMN-containing flavoprotein (pyridoxamine 5'-phosphate oxidase superfamily)
VSRRMTEQECQQFLAQPHIGVLSVASDADRLPLTVPLWYGYQPGSNITFFTGTQGRKARKTNLIRKAGVLSLLVQREGYPYGYVTVEGTAVGEERPPSAERMLAIARRYQSEETARGFVEAELENPSGELVLFEVRSDRCLSADFTDEGG